MLFLYFSAGFPSMGQVLFLSFIFLNLLNSYVSQLILLSSRMIVSIGDTFEHVYISYQTYRKLKRKFASPSSSMRI